MAGLSPKTVITGAVVSGGGDEESSSSKMVLSKAIPPIDTKAFWIWSNSAHISFNLWVPSLIFAGLCEVSRFSSTSSASWRSAILLSLNSRVGIEFTLFWISNIVSWDTLYSSAKVWALKSFVCITTANIKPKIYVK